MDSLLEFVAGHPLLVTGTLLMLVAVLLFEMRLRGRAGIELSVPEAVRMINKGASVVDVRPADRYSNGHIVDALNMQPDELRQAAGESSTVERPGKAGPVAGQGKAGKAGKGRDRLRKKNGVLVVCDDGGESHRCARQLQAAGFGAAFNLKGGIAAWQRENQPLVAPKGRPA